VQLGGVCPRFARLHYDRQTLEDTERNIREAIEGHLRTLFEFGDAVPQPTSAARDIEIQPAA
jgi:predicted RNase H-like HicB family nuclease